MDFVPCVKWSARGAVCGKPEKVELTREELVRMVNEENCDDNSAEVSDIYDMEHYDTENPSGSSGIGSIALLENTEMDSHINIPGMDSSDTEDEEDEVIRAEDNLIAVGKGSRDNSCSEAVELHVYNEEDGHVYIHHDITLRSCPLCLEFVPAVSSEGRSLLIGVGLMNGNVQLYDANVVNAMRPQGKLGSKRKDDKGHTDAVSGLSHNATYPHILASCSVDETVALWDLESLSLSTRMRQFKGRVEGVEWRPSDGHVLLTCDSSGEIKLFDCRTDDVVKQFKVKGEALVATWSDNEHFLAGTSRGYLLRYDLRQDTPLVKIKAHDSDITSICPITLNQIQVSLSCSVDGEIKLLKFTSDTPEDIFSKQLDSEQLHCSHLSPDNPLIAAVGGARKRGSYFTILNLNKNNHINKAFNPDVQVP